MKTFRQYRIFEKDILHQETLIITTDENKAFTSPKKEEMIDDVVYFVEVWIGEERQEVHQYSPNQEVWFQSWVKPPPPIDYIRVSHRSNTAFITQDHKDAFDFLTRKPELGDWIIASSEGKILDMFFWTGMQDKWVGDNKDGGFPGQETASE